MINDADIDALPDCTAYDRDGNKLGKVGEVYLDNRNNEPTWVRIDTGLFGNRHSFVPLDKAAMNGQSLRLPYGKEMVEGAPTVDAANELTAAEEVALYRYYQREDTDVGDSAASKEPREATGGEQPGPRLRKRTVTEIQTVNVPVEREEYYIDEDREQP